MLTINGVDMTDELHGFAETIGLEAAAPGRYSILLLLQLLDGYASRTLNTENVIREVRALERTGRPTGTKTPQPFRHPPLKGLWHKHYLAAGRSTFARNLGNGLIKDGLPRFEQHVRDTLAVGDVHDLTSEDIKRIVHDAVLGNWERRTNASELTGEWIVYAKHDGNNYYLSLGKHNDDDTNLRDEIEASCRAEFPFVADILL